MTVQTPVEPELSVQQVNRKVAVGAAFMVLGRLGIRLISVVSTLILVRLLVPEDFGLIALAGAAVTLAETLTATGYAVVLVRRQTVEPSLYDTAWTLNLLRCVLLGLLIGGTASWQAALLGDERIAPLLQVIAVTIAVDGLASAGLIRLQRELRFDRLFRHQLLGRLVAFMATIALAWTTQSYWSLVLGNLIAKAFTLPYGYILAPYRPRWSLQHWRELLSFSKWAFAQNLCAIADGQAVNLVLGRIVGVQAVGVFNVAYQIAATPVTELAAPVRQPIYSGYARILHDLPLLRRQFISGLGLHTAALLPLSVGIALVAPEVERLALGAAWAGTAAVIAACALYALCDASAHFTFNVFAVLGRQGRLTAVYAVMVAIRLPLLILGTLVLGLPGAMAVMVCTSILNALVWNWQVGRLLGLRPADFGAALWRSAAAAALMALAVTALRALLPDEPGFGLDMLRLGCLSLFGAAVHLTAQWLLWRACGSPPGAEAQIARAGARVLRRFVRFGAPVLRH